MDIDDYSMISGFVTAFRFIDEEEGQMHGMARIGLGVAYAASQHDAIATLEAAIRRQNWTILNDRLNAFRLGDVGLSVLDYPSHMDHPFSKLLGEAGRYGVSVCATSTWVPLGTLH